VNQHNQSSDESQTVVTEKFFKLEEELNLFDVRSENIAIWERIRRPVYREILSKLNIIDAPSTINKKSATSYIRGFYLWARNGLLRNPLFEDKHKVLFYGHSRRKKLEDGYWWDLYCDPIHNQAVYDYLHIELPYRLSHKTPPKTENLQYLDFIEYTGTIKEKFSLFDTSINYEIKNVLQEAESRFSDYFSIQTHILRKCQKHMRWHASTKPLYDKLLRRIDPDVVIIVVSYTREPFISACKDANIPVIELQHGVIHPQHLGYSYPGGRTKETFPDYLFTWGNFWNETVTYPVPDSQIISVGYPYLERRQERYDSVNQKEQILLLSQPNVGSRLSKKAIEMQNSDKINHDIIYKLHPGEYDKWRENYPWLENKKIRIIDSDDPSLYHLFSESEVQVGVGSTALYEGLNFGLETYVFDLPGNHIVNPLIESGYATAVSSVEELEDEIGKGKKTNKVDTEYFFKNNAIKNTIESIDQIRRK
jgi:hypothetical protein